MAFFHFLIFKGIGNRFIVWGCRIEGLALIDMRYCRKNRQRMYYSVPLGTDPIYVTDEYGNIQYDKDEDGDLYPMETGEYKDGYSDPKEFLANIGGQLRQTLMSEFGVISSPNYGVMVVGKDQYDFPIGTLIWKKSAIKYKEDGSLDSTSADYSVLGVIDEFINEDTYYLHKRSK